MGGASTCNEFNKTLNSSPAHHTFIGSFLTNVIASKKAMMLSSESGRPPTLSASTSEIARLRSEISMIDGFGLIRFSGHWGSEIGVTLSNKEMIAVGVTHTISDGQ